jgi:hypothetical protein
MLPAMMRLFFNSIERTVEFVPRSPDKVALAEQQTEYVNHVFLRENSGLLLTSAVLEDAFVRRLGVAKFWAEEQTKVETTRYTGLTQEQLELLASDPDTELAGLEQDEDGGFSVEARRSVEDVKLMVRALPREEFWYNRRARDRDDALVMAHATYLTVSKLREMGIEQDLIDEATTEEDPNSHETAIRDPDGLGGTADEAAREENALVLYVEAYPNLDVDGDGVAELRRVCTLGPSFTIVSNDPTDMRPFAFLTPYPLAHRLEGLDVSDLTMDMQLLESSLARSILDSAALSLFPRMGVVEGAVEMRDVLSTEIGAIIRMKAPGMIEEISHRFIGGDVMPMLEWVQQKKENRTGRARGPDGLDQDALQSTVKEGVQAAVSASRDRLELLARVAAETFFKPLFIGLYKLAKKHSSRETMIRMKGAWVPVDPRTWDEEPEVMVNVALGDGQTDQKLEVLTGIKQTIETYMAQMGPDNPLCGFAELRAVLERATRLAGEQDVDRYFKKIDPMNPPKMPEPQPDPKVAIEQQKLQLEGQRLQLEGQKLQFEQQMETQKMQLDMQKTSFDAQLSTQKLQIQQERVQRTLASREQQMQQSHELAVMKLQLESELQRAELALKYGNEEAKRAADQSVRALEAGIEQQTRALEAGVDRETRLDEADIRSGTELAKAEITSKVEPNDG